MSGLRRREFAALAVALAGGCSLLPPPPGRTPMDVMRLDGPCPGPAPVLLIMLPGAYSRPQEFVDEGFVDAVRRRGLAADIVIADAHLGYYNERSVLRRLHEDVVLPARAQGYRRIWLVGISIGGFGALGYAARRIGAIDGIVAIAPYLGPRALLQEIEVDGGPRPWRTQVHARNEDDLEREVWEWLTTPPADAPPVYLAYGRDDRFADAHRLLSTVLPAGPAIDLPGGHDWAPWRALWNAWLDLGMLPPACAP